MNSCRLIARLMSGASLILALSIAAVSSLQAGTGSVTIMLKDGVQLTGEILAVGDSTLAYTFTSSLDDEELRANPGFISLVRIAKIRQITAGGTSHGWAGFGLGLAAGVAIGVVVGSNVMDEPTNTVERIIKPMATATVAAEYGVIGGVAGGLLGGVIGAGIVSGEMELHPDDPTQRDALRQFARYPDLEPEHLVTRR